MDRKQIKAAALATLLAVLITACSKAASEEDHTPPPDQANDTGRTSEDDSAAFTEFANELDAERRSQAAAVEEGVPKGPVPSSAPPDPSRPGLPTGASSHPAPQHQATPFQAVSSSASQRLWNEYMDMRSKALFDLTLEAVGSPIFITCKDQPFKCHIDRCRTYASDLGFLFNRSGFEAVVQNVSESPTGPKLARSCAYALTVSATDVPDVVGSNPIARRNDDFTRASFMFSLAERLNPDRKAILRDAFEFALFSARGAEQAADANDWLDAYRGIAGSELPMFQEAQAQYDFVQRFWSVWDVTRRLGVNMGEPVTLSPKFDADRSFRSGGRTFTADDVVDRYYEMNNAGWRNGYKYADAYWGNGFYANAYTTDDSGHILIRVDRRTYEVTVEFLKERDITSDSDKMKAILDYGMNGNAHGYNWDESGFRTFLSRKARPFHEWYDMTLPSEDFYALPQRERINHMRARQNMPPLPEDWRLR